MAKMRAIEAAVQVLLKEGVTAAFGLPGAAINPLYAAMRKIGGIDHVLARLSLVGNPGSPAPRAKKSCRRARSFDARFRRA